GRLYFNRQVPYLSYLCLPTRRSSDLGTAVPSSEVTDLLAECRKRGIPTVFWNKEDPPHFDDFLPLAKLFDVVFTSDVRLVNEYRDRKSTRLNSSHVSISYAIFCLKKK